MLTTITPKRPPEITRITEPEHGYHWFGYYDKLQTSPDDRYVLAMRIQFENRQPDGQEMVEIGMIDTNEEYRWTAIGESRAWCWQQGCMLQFVPGQEHRILWNDRDGDRFVTRLLDRATGVTRTIARAVYTLSPDGRWGVTTDFRRLDDMRPGYGYPGIPDPNADVLAPDDSGVWRIDLETDESKLLFSVADVAAIPSDYGIEEGSKHYFNHLLISPGGGRIEFLHRWRPPSVKTWATRMMTCSPDGSDLRVATDSGLCSHFIWDDPEHILACCADAGTRQLCRIHWRNRELEVIDTEGLPSPDGHVSVLPGHDGRFLLTDGTVRFDPDGSRTQSVYLHDRHHDTVMPIATFDNPPGYSDLFRIDLHPRSNRAGTAVFVDAGPANGRQQYKIDLGSELFAQFDR